MEITVERIALIRENYNPKNTNLNLNIDWSVEFTHTDQSVIKYDIIFIVRKKRRFIMAYEKKSIKDILDKVNSRNIYLLCDIRKFGIQ